MLTHVLYAVNLATLPPRGLPVAAGFGNGLTIGPQKPAPPGRTRPGDAHRNPSRGFRYDHALVVPA
jgi:hypothetical protein